MIDVRTVESGPGYRVLTIAVTDLQAGERAKIESFPLFEVLEIESEWQGVSAQPAILRTKEAAVGDAIRTVGQMSSAGPALLEKPGWQGTTYGACGDLYVDFGATAGASGTVRIALREGWLPRSSSGGGSGGAVTVEEWNAGTLPVSGAVSVANPSLAVTQSGAWSVDIGSSVALDVNLTNASVAVQPVAGADAVVYSVNTAQTISGPAPSTNLGAGNIYALMVEVDPDSPDDVVVEGKTLRPGQAWSWAAPTGGKLAFTGGGNTIAHTLNGSTIQVQALTY